MTIKEAREESGLSQREMSELLGIPKRTIENWETGERNPPDYVARLVVEKLQAQNGSEEIAIMGNLKKDYAVIEEMEIIREYASAILADIMLYKKEHFISEDEMNNIIVLFEEEVANIRQKVYDISTLKEAYETKGKLKIVKDVLENLKNKEG